MPTFVGIFKYANTDISVSWLPKTAAEVVAKVSLQAVFGYESVRGDQIGEAVLKFWQWFLKPYALFNFPWNLAASTCTVELAFERFPELVKVWALAIGWRTRLVTRPRPRARFYLKPYWIT